MQSEKIYNPFEAIERRLSFLESNLNNLHESVQEAIPDIFDTDSICKYLGNVSKPTLYRWIHTKHIPNYRIGKRVYFNRNEIDEWMKSKRRLTIKERVQHAKERS